MFGLIFGSAKIDAYRAEVIHLYLTTFHRTHTTLGFDSLLRTIKANPNISNYQDRDDFKAFRVPGDLDDFEFMISTHKASNAKQTVSVFGSGLYRGFNVDVQLETGKYLMFMRDPTTRASSLCRVFENKYSGQRIG